MQGSEFWKRSSRLQEIVTVSFLSGYVTFRHLCKQPFVLTNFIIIIIIIILNFNFNII